MDSFVNRDFLFDIAKLLDPISTESPSGENLRYEGAYDDIKEARREDDHVLDRGVWKMAMKKAEWGNVEKLCVDLLQKRTKDLQVAAWLMEAWLRLYGVPGLRDGLRLLAALSSDFWDTVYPLADEGDLDFRVAPFEWANDKLPVIVKLVPITHPEGESSRPYCWADWESACRPARPDSSGNLKESQVTQAKFQQSVLLTTAKDFTDLLATIDAALLATSRLTAVLDEKCGSYSPSLGQLTSTLTSMRGLVFSVLNQRPAPQPEDIDAEGQEAGMEVDPNLQGTEEAQESGPFAAGPIRSRAEAYRRLSEAADYLARTEPHSPTPYLVRRAILWGGMKLEDLLPELVRNSTELTEIYRLLQMGKKT